ncbi:hypothetical protein POM88_052643 [Heracleum sosnowskyi]|uniref:Uncharacterized protein n=1 Tax=Heracleum sosnowskyi TaxID=360622 RepID=A0AAD8GPU7_9APIA|nr:hypothetical protein POM88_052643 [Heracleum sosnowskyi]
MRGTSIYGKAMIWKELEEEYNGEKGCTPSRRGPHSRGRMTRPLKNHKINWLCENWWNIETEFQWVKRRNLSYHLKKEQVQTLRPGGHLVDDVVNGYLQLLKEREFKYNEDEFSGEGGRKYFFMPSDFMVQAENYSSHPDQKSSAAMYKFDK